MSPHRPSPGVRRAAAVVLALALAACRVTGEAAEPPPEPTLYGLRLTNDIGTLHENYTHGTELWLSQPIERSPELLHDLADSWFLRLMAWPMGLDRDAPDRRVLHYRLAQEIYTPVDLEPSFLQVDDLPYAAWLHAGLAVERTRLDPDPERRRDRRATVELDVGIVGPSALGEPIQVGWHDFWELQPANGWDHQLKDEPTLLLVRRHDWRVVHTPVTDGRDLDVLAFADWNLGNLRTGLELGTTLRFGHDLPRDFGLRSPARPGAGAEEGGGTHLFLDAGLRCYAQDLLLDGNTWKDSHSVEKEPLVGQVGLGISLPLGPLRLRLARTLRDEEFEGQEGSRGIWTLDLARLRLHGDLGTLDLAGSL